MATIWLALVKELLLCSLHCPGQAYLKSRFVLAQVGQPGLNSYPFIGELSSSSWGFSFDIILNGVLSFLRVSH
jgi:hypothetical protein